MKRNLLDITGLSVGQAEDTTAKTGVSVVLAKKGAVCGVDVRGSAPGTRETDLLDPINMIEAVHAVVLSGGSAFGLNAAGGVMRYLEEQGIGHDVGCTHVPIVPQAVLFDLAYGDHTVRPDAEMGYAACLAASEEVLLEGSVGAGCGATVGKLLGMEQCSKSGIGSWSEQLPNGIIVAALIAVNAFGDICDGNTILAGTKDPATAAFLNTEEALLSANASPALSGQNTTIGIIATNARLTKAQAKKIAGMAHDGLARCIRPIHTTLDGDTLFCMATGESEATPDINQIGTLAARVTQAAVLRCLPVKKT